MISMNVLRWIKEAILWCLLAILFYVVGTFVAFPLLRGTDLRASGTPMDWMDSAIGILGLVLISGAVLWMRLHFVRAKRRAAQPDNAAADAADRS
tara:strand:+ start:95 stop:379 length:285 start_codon:yes stop_codon:yes gene_type:complete